MKKLSVWLLVFGMFSQQACAAEEVVNIYSYRQAYLIEPILEKFTEQTGIKYNIVFAKSGIAERLKREGEFSPADIVLTTDGSRMVELAESDLTQAVTDETLLANIPKKYRDDENHWFALTLRVRNLFTQKDAFSGKEWRYEDLADEKFPGKICMRSGRHPYNVALIASIIAHKGKDQAKQWLQGVKAHLARKPQGNDRAQISALESGLCDVAIANSYYYGKMLDNPEQRDIALAARINFPNSADRGSHVNASGVVMAKHAPNRGNALKLMRFLSQDTAQEMYAEVNMEYPVKAGVKPSDLLASWGVFKADTLSLDALFNYRTDALKLLDEVKFDL